MLQLSDVRDPITGRALRPTLSIAETAELLGLGINQARDAVRRGEIPALRFNTRNYRIPVPALLRLLGEQPEEPAQAASGDPREGSPLANATTAGQAEGTASNGALRVC